MTENSGIKRCGIVRRGVACETVIPVSASACAECHASVVAELERMADDPVPERIVLREVPRGTVLPAERRGVIHKLGEPIMADDADLLGTGWRLPR